ncbi:hypothetical protein L3X38_004790 [Prunus dulcis]|uniref:Uncharacterized protein n=1 Tax=Prunus dulcis TaxID=3755 RepID=A0AAD4ZPP1_PRUDU|nr:hypothetical protein L3X38_004790 [Prunus dulcis]
MGFSDFTLTRTSLSAARCSNVAQSTPRFQIKPGSEAMLEFSRTLIEVKVTLRSGQPSIGVPSSKTVEFDFWGFWGRWGGGLVDVVGGVWGVVGEDKWGNKMSNGDVGIRGLGSVCAGIRGWCGKNGKGKGGMRGNDVKMEGLGRE